MTAVIARLLISTVAGIRQLRTAFNALRGWGIDALPTGVHHLRVTQRSSVVAPIHLITTPEPIQARRVEENKRRRGSNTDPKP